MERDRIFAVDEFCPPAPADGHFWRRVREELLAWASPDGAGVHRFRVDAEDLDAMCAEYEAAIVAVGGLDVVMLGLGPNGHIACGAPGTPVGVVTIAALRITRQPAPHR